MQSLSHWFTRQDSGYLFFSCYFLNFLSVLQGIHTDWINTYKYNSSIKKKLVVLATKFNLTFNTFIKLMNFYPAAYQTFQCLCTVISSYSDSFTESKEITCSEDAMNIRFIRLFLSVYQGLRKRDTLMLHLNIILFN